MRSALEIAKEIEGNPLNWALGFNEIDRALIPKILAEAVVQQSEQIAKLTEENEKLKKHFDNCNSDKIVTQSQALKEAEVVIGSRNLNGYEDRCRAWETKHGSKNDNE